MRSRPEEIRSFERRRSSVEVREERLVELDATLPTPLKGPGGERWAVRPKAEVDLYREIGLAPKVVSERNCLVRDDIDWSQKDARGRTNLERADGGRAPLDSVGREHELHHVGQEEDGPLAELTRGEHQSQTKLLHPKRESTVDHGSDWTRVRAEHWKARAETVRAMVAGV